MVSISYFDVLGESPSFYYKGESRYKTTFGGLLSINIFLLSAGLLSYFLVRLFSRTNALVVQSTEYKDDGFLDYSDFPQIIQINKQGGSLFTIEEENKLFMVELIYFYTEEDGSSEQTSEFYKLKRCEESDFRGKYSMFSQLSNLDRYFCFPPELNLKLYGLYGGVKKYAATMLSISRCKFGNATDCYSDEEAKSLLSNFYASFAFIDFNIQNSEVSEPGKPYLRQERIQAGVSLFKRLFYTVKLIDYETDIGYLFEDLRKDEFFKTSEFSLIPDVSVPRSYFAVTFSLSKHKVFIKRQYEKFQQLLSNFGGAVKAFMLLGQGICFLLNRNFYFDSLIKRKEVPVSVNLSRDQSHENAKIGTSSTKNVEMNWKTNILYFLGWNSSETRTFKEKVNKLKLDLSIENVLGFIRNSNVQQNRKPEGINISRLR